MTKAKLLNKNFLLLWQGQFISMIGSQVFSIAMVFWIKHHTNSASIMGLMLMASSITGVLLTIAGGIFADRYNRRNIVIWCDSLSAIAMCMLLAVFMISNVSTEYILTGIFITAITIAAFNAFFAPSISAAIPDLVPGEKVNGANSMFQLSIQLSILLGQGLGGLFYRILGTELLVFVNAASYMVSAVMSLFVKIPQKMPSRERTNGKEFKQITRELYEGFNFIWKNEGLKRLILMSTILNLLSMPVILLLPFYIEDFLKLPSEWYGFLLAAYSAGSLLGYLFAGLIRTGQRMQRLLILVFMIVEPLGYAILTLINSGYIALPAAGIAGIMRGFITVNILSILQITTPSEIRGRVVGVLTTLSGAMAPLGAGLAGIIFDLTGHNISLIYICCALLMIITVIITSMNSAFRKYLEINYQSRQAEYPLAEDSKSYAKTIN